MHKRAVDQNMAKEVDANKYLKGKKRWKRSMVAVFRA